MITSFSVTPAKREAIPAVVHVDDTVRPQTVERAANERYHEVIKRFGELSGESVVLNTSLNVKGEPIICHPREAIRAFFDTGLDHLVLGNYVLSKDGGW
jgi:carbamoyltransferase